MSETMETNGKNVVLREEELVERFLKLRKEGLDKGLHDDDIKYAFRKQYTQTWGEFFTSRGFQMQVIIAFMGIILASRVVFRDYVDTYVYDSMCIVPNNPLLSEIARPLANCEICRGLKQAPIERAISTEDFVQKYAYSKVPVLIKEATSNWTAMDTFSYEYFKTLYTKTGGALESVEDECQFFPYKTEFETLADAFNMSDERAAYTQGESPWYFGWSNCHRKVASELRSHYQRPYFLPNDSESSTLDWIFMGGPGIGAFMHLDSVGRPSWQAQISGTKTWKLLPSPECDSVCHGFDIKVEKGDIIIIDTNEWYHETHVHPGELSITIGSEYD